METPSPDVMRAARLHGIEDLRIESVPVRPPGPRELLVRIEACGICSTDARKHRIGVNDGEYPFNPGHEWVGSVEALGANAVKWEVGQRVYGDTYGGYAEYATISIDPEGWSCGAVPIDADLPLERAVFLEPLADCLHAVQDQARVGAGDRVVVFSAGSMGLQLVALSSREGGRILVVEPRPERRDLARSFGAEEAAAPEGWQEVVRRWSDRRGFDVAIVAVGRGDLVASATEVAAPGARIVAFAGFGNEPEATIDLNLIHYRELSIVGSEWIGAPPNQRPERYLEARELLTSGALPLERLVTRTCGFEELNRALVDLGAQRELKTVFYPDGAR
jgi:L-iditol 2-dehydrogenase